MMACVNNVWPEGKSLEIGRHGDRIALKESLILAQVAAICENEVASAIEIAGEIANEQIGSPRQSS